MNTRLWLCMTLNLLIQSVLMASLSERKSNFNVLHTYITAQYDDDASLIANFEKIQSAFCPDQIHCSTNKTQVYDIDQTGNETASGAYMIGNTSLTLGSLSRLGVCCLPCSCEDSCFLDGNCCLDKIRTQTNSSIERKNAISHDCVPADAVTYINKKASRKAELTYWMVTECFIKTLNASLVQLCEHPDPYRVEQVYPVTSLTSGHTYWNYFCALCNNDANWLGDWNITIISNGYFFYYANGSTSSVMPEHFQEVYTDMVDAGAIFYLPPSGIKPKACVPSNAVLGCKRPNDQTLESNSTFLQEVCEQFHLPVIMQTMPYKNIFCFLCGAGVFDTNYVSSCHGGEEKFLADALITGLITFREKQIYNEKGDDPGHFDENGCSCAQIYDIYSKECRQWYCSPGDINTKCTCQPLPIQMSGMPVVVKIKVRATQSQPLPSSSAALRRLRNTIESLFTTNFKAFSAETMATFRSDPDQSHPYQLHVLEIRTKQGLDTKVELREIVERQDRTPLFEFESGQTHLEALLTNQVQTWFDGPSRPDTFFAKDILTSETLQRTYLLKKLETLTPRQVMEAKKMLYCRQVELSSDEFNDNNGTITVNANPDVFIGLNYIYVDDGAALRVCIDDYSPSRVSSATYKVMSFYLIIFGLWIQVLRSK